MTSLQGKSWNRTEDEVQVLKENLSTFFLMVCGGIVFFMHSGFAFLEAGTVRTKNTTNVVLKNLIDSCIGGLVYWAVGFGFAYGEGNPFIGANYFFLNQLLPSFPYDDAFFFFQFSFAAACTTIIAGGMAERTAFPAYMIYSAINTGFIYPVVSHWVWYEGGWLKLGVEGGLPFQDFAGSGVVHVTGGTVALVGAVILGPRIGRYDSHGKQQPIEEYNISYVALGTFILLFGFLFFNGGSALSMSNYGDNALASRAITSTFLSFSAGGLVTLLICRIVPGKKKWSFPIAANGCLTGAVAICAGCDVMPSWAAVITGCVSGVVYLMWSWIVPKAGVDDPLEAAAVHLGGGLWGLVSVPLFHERIGIFQTFSRISFVGLGWNLLGGFVIFIWSAVMATIMFGTLRIFRCLRVSDVEEDVGLDISLHGEPAYPWVLSAHNNDSQVTERFQYTDLSTLPAGADAIHLEKPGHAGNTSINKFTSSANIKLQQTDEKSRLVPSQEK